MSAMLAEALDSLSRADVLYGRGRGYLHRGDAGALVPRLVRAVASRAVADAKGVMAHIGLEQRPRGSGLVKVEKPLAWWGRARRKVRGDRQPWPCLERLTAGAAVTPALCASISVGDLAPKEGAAQAEQRRPSSSSSRYY